MVRLQEFIDRLQGNHHELMSLTDDERLLVLAQAIQADLEEQDAHIETLIAEVDELWQRLSDPEEKNG